MRGLRSGCVSSRLCPKPLLLLWPGWAVWKEDRGAEDGLLSQVSSCLSPLPSCPKALPCWLVASPDQSERFAGPGRDVLLLSAAACGAQESSNNPNAWKKKLFQVTEQMQSKLLGSTMSSLATAAGGRGEMPPSLWCCWDSPPRQCLCPRQLGAAALLGTVTLVLFWDRHRATCYSSGYPHPRSGSI